MKPNPQLQHIRSEILKIYRYPDDDHMYSQNQSKYSNFTIGNPDQSDEDSRYTSNWSNGEPKKSGSTSALVRFYNEANKDEW